MKVLSTITTEPESMHQFSFGYFGIIFNCETPECNLVLREVAEPQRRLTVHVPSSPVNTYRLSKYEII